MDFYQKIYSRFCDFLNTPRKIIRLLFFLGIAISVMMLFVPVFYRDSVHYIACAKALQLKNWDLALDLTITPGIPFLGGMLMYLGFDEMQGVTLASSLFGIALIIPCYGVLSFFMDKKYAAWGTALFFLIPQNIEASFSPLMDSGRWFFFFLSWYLILKFLQQHKYRYLIFSGCSYAGFSLVRSEGIVFVALFSVYFLFELFRTSGWKKDGKTTICNFAFVIIPLLTAFILLLPRIIQCQIYTGYPALDMRQTWAVRGVLNNFFPQAEQAGMPSYGSVKDFNGSWFLQAAFHRRFWNNIVTGCFIPYLLTAIYGAFLIFRRKCWKYVHSLFLVFMAENAFVFFIMRSNAGRYFYLHAFFIMPFTLYGLKEIVNYIRHFSYGKYILLPAALILCGVLLYRGTSNFRYSNMKHYPVLGKFMLNYSQSKPMRSKLKHPVYLIIGDNYGWGYQCKGSEIFYSAYMHLSDEHSLKEVLKDGVPAKYCYYAAEYLTPEFILKPDYVIEDDNRHPEILQSCQELLQEIEQTQFKDVKLYKVIEPHEK